MHNTNDHFGQSSNTLTFHSDVPPMASYCQLNKKHLVLHQCCASWETHQNTHAISSISTADLARPLAVGLSLRIDRPSHTSRFEIERCVQTRRLLRLAPADPRS
jgi:hypothetical protein